MESKVWAKINTMTKHRIRSKQFFIKQQFERSKNKQQIWNSFSLRDKRNFVKYAKCYGVTISGSEFKALYPRCSIGLKTDDNFKNGQILNHWVQFLKFPNISGIKYYIDICNDSHVKISADYWNTTYYATKVKIIKKYDE